MSPWSRSNISPSDWIGILSQELEADSVQPSLNAMRNWLDDNGYRVETTSISRLKSIQSCSASLSAAQSKMIETISENVSARSCILYFEDLCYRAFKFFNPFGNPMRLAVPSSLPTGVYQATRYSFSSPGRLVRSAFLFYRNEKTREALDGYSDNGGVTGSNGLSEVVRFKELRILGDEGKPKYQLLVGGFVFYNHGCFYLAGASFETSPGVLEHKMQVADIRHVQMVYYILHDDADPEVIRGFKATGLRHKHQPAAAVIELERVRNLSFPPREWYKVQDKRGVEIGEFPIDRPSGGTHKDLRRYVDRLRPSIDQEFQMLTVDRLPDS